MTELPPDGRSFDAACAEVERGWWADSLSKANAERDALKARVVELEAALAARATEFQRALKADVAARLRLSDDVEALSDENLRLREQDGDMAEERDALLDRIAELKRQLGIALRGQGAIDYSKVIDPMVSENDALKARVDLLTTALTGLIDIYDQGVWRGKNNWDAAWGNARAVLSAAPTESEA